MEEDRAAAYATHLPHPRDEQASRERIAAQSSLLCATAGRVWFISGGAWRGVAVLLGKHIKHARVSEILRALRGLIRWPPKETLVVRNDLHPRRLNVTTFVVSPTHI